MTKRRLIAQTSQATGLGRQAVQLVIEAAIDEIREALVVRDPVALPGLGMLTAHQHAGQPRRHPTTGESLVTRPFHSVRFRASAGLKRRLRDS